MPEMSTVMSSVTRKFLDSIDRANGVNKNAAMLNYRKIAANLKSIVEQLSSIIEDLAFVAGDSVEAKEAKVKAEKGLCCYCSEPHGDSDVFRGDHEKCYKKVMRAIAQKVITEDQAISRGWILARESGGRKRKANDPIGQTLKSSTKKKS